MGTAGRLARAGASLCIPSGSGPIVAPVVDNFQLSASNLRAVGYGKARLKNKVDPTASENRRVEVFNHRRSVPRFRFQPAGRLLPSAPSLGLHLRGRVRFRREFVRGNCQNRGGGFLLRPSGVRLWHHRMGRRARIGRLGIIGALVALAIDEFFSFPD